MILIHNEPIENIDKVRVVDRPRKRAKSHYRIARHYVRPFRANGQEVFICDDCMLAFVKESTPIFVPTRSILI